MSAGWQTDAFELVHGITGAETIEVHIAPVEDMEPHIIEIAAATAGDDQACRCSPAVTVDNDGIYTIIHNAFDGRDIIEEIERGPQTQ